MDSVETFFERLVTGSKQLAKGIKASGRSHHSEPPVLEFSSKNRRRLSWCRCLVKNNG